MRTPLSPRHRMMDWLARREYGFEELVVRGCRDLELPRDQAEQLVQQLADDGLQCDRRFVESWIRSRISKWQGPVKIKSELRHKGVSMSLVSLMLEEAEVDWSQLARQRLFKKFGDVAAADAKEKAKRVRYLVAQGYPEGIAMRLVLD